jgi:hypothetical protein
MAKNEFHLSLKSIYIKSIHDLLLFAHVTALLSVMPHISLNKAIIDFCNKYNIAENSNIESLVVTYSRMRAEFTKQEII